MEKWSLSEPPVKVLSDLKRFEEEGFWRDADGRAVIPKWAQDLAEKLHVGTGSMHITHAAWREIALFVLGEVDV